MLNAYIWTCNDACAYIYICVYISRLIYQSACRSTSPQSTLAEGSSVSARPRKLRRKFRNPLGRRRFGRQLASFGRFHFVAVIFDMADLLAHAHAVRPVGPREFNARFKTVRARMAPYDFRHGLERRIDERNAHVDPCPRGEFAVGVKRQPAFADV